MAGAFPRVICLYRVNPLQTAAQRKGAGCASWLGLDVALGNSSGEPLLLDFSLSVLLVHSSSCSSPVRGCGCEKESRNSVGTHCGPWQEGGI